MLMSQTEQLDYEPKVHLFQPYVVGGKTKVTLTAWPPHASDQHILLHSDSLLTVCDPSPTVKAMYLQRINKQESDFDPPEPTEEPVLLNEDEQMPSYIPDDDYEPNYTEI